jgi:metal-responsive CopG/Arc/MetJ family transcriptional regulator
MAMVKVNVSLEEDVRDDLMRLVPPRKRSQVINDALRKELLCRKRESATEKLRLVRRRTATLSSREILGAVRSDRARGR